MSINSGILFLALAVLLDAIDISLGMPPKPRDSRKNVEKSNENANRQEMSTSIPPRRVTYLHDVGSSSGHAHRQELSSTLRTVDELFPGCNGVLPRIEPISRSRTVNFHNLRQFGGRKMIEPEPSVFAARDYVIIGWVNRDCLDPLSTLFNRPDVCVVFDMIKDQWYTLHQDEFQKLGPGRNMNLVRTRDDIAYILRPTSDGPIGVQAHISACEHANREADRIEALPEENFRRQNSLSPLGNRMVRMARGYTRTYIDASANYMNTHQTNQTGM